MNKTNLYIDGTNLFVGLIDLFGIKKIPDFSSILKDINKIVKVDKIFFYASYTPPSNKKYKDSIIAEAKFYKKVIETPNLIFYKGHRSPTSGKEKGVDVHLAVDIIKHGFEDKYQQMIIFTGDADLTYPLEIVRDLGKSTYAIFIPNRFSLGISHRANNSFILNYFDKFKPLRPDLPKTLKIVKVKNPVRKRTR